MSTTAAQHADAAQPTAAMSSDVASGLDIATADSSSSRWLRVAEIWKFPNASRIEVAQSWEERIGRLAPSERSYLREVNGRYLQSLAFSSAQEQQRLLDQGFPMPEEWLAARDLVDSDLEALAKTDNLKAQMFHIDRVGQQVGAVLDAQGGLDTARPEHVELLGRMAAAAGMNRDMLGSKRTPFAAYQYGQFRYATTPTRPPEYLASGLLLAGDLGDTRVDRLWQAFAREYKELDGSFLMQVYSGQKQLIILPH